MEENMIVARDSPQGLFWVAFIVQALHQSYEVSQLSQIVPNLRCAHNAINRKKLFKTKLTRG